MFLNLLCEDSNKLYLVATFEFLIWFGLDKANPQNLNFLVSSGWNISLLK